MYVGNATEEDVMYSMGGQQFTLDRRTLKMEALKQGMVVEFFSQTGGKTAKSTPLPGADVIVLLVDLNGKWIVRIA